MNPDWIDFLTQTGVKSDGDGALHFGDPDRELRAALTGDVVCDLSPQGLIAVTGTDAVSFLQGQFTSDVREVTPVHSQLSAYCTPKGRMLACFRLFRRGDGYFLSLPRDRVEPLLKRLRMFVMRAQVMLADASDTEARIGLTGPRAVEWLQPLLGALPAAVDEVAQAGDVTAIRVPGAPPRFELYGGVAVLSELWRQLAGSAVPAGAEPWRLLDIQAGIPAVYGATAEAFIPQMTNLQLVNGVSFSKGCYTGQEIVARTQHLGTLKRRMRRARVAGGACPQPGEMLFGGQPEAGGDGAGQVVDACRHPDGGCELLAVVRDDCVGGEVRLGGTDGARLEFLPLPYELPVLSQQQ